MKNKILIVSDNHGVDNITLLKEKEDCKYSFHAGDSQFLFDSSNMRDFDFKVKGNCDYDIKYPEEVISQINEIGNFLILHGHQKAVKYSSDELKQYCEQKKINLCVYGHTHILNVQYIKEKDLLIINPGSTTYSRSEYPQTYVVLMYSNEQYEIEVKDIKNNEKIKKVKYLRK